MSPATLAALSRRPAVSPVCRHCGAPLPDETARTTGFCCAGCAYVHRLVHEHGLGGYYRIKDTVTAPVDSTVFHSRDFAWLATLQQEAEHTAGPATARGRLGIQGISCAGCVWLIEKLFHQQPGAREIVVNPQLGQMELGWRAGEFSAADFAQKLHAFNYLVGPPDRDQGEAESRALVRRIGLCAAFALNIMLFTLPAYFGMTRDFEYARLFGLLALTFATLSLLVGGGYFVQRAWQGIRHGILHLDLPISLGIVGAYLGSLYGWITGNAVYVYFDFVGAFVVLMLVGRWAQVVAVERNRRRLLAQQPRPESLPVYSAAGPVTFVAPEALLAGQTYGLKSS
ncbi:MAG: heavy metal translocating P-type ATPase metal-binding domain-containing protein, partial [Opitutales bacterium]